MMFKPTLGRSLIAVVMFLSGLAAIGCGNRVSAPGARDETSALVVLNAPVGGTVRRVLVGEGISVKEGTPVIEIERDAARPAPTAGDNAAERAARAGAAARDSQDALRREVERASVEVQRVEALVAQNAAPQAQLDAARAVYQGAQERLQQRQDAAASSALIVNDNRAATNDSGARPNEDTVYVRATAQGSVRVVAVRAGQRVAAGQPVVTLAAPAR